MAATVPAEATTPVGRPRLAADDCADFKIDGVPRTPGSARIMRYGLAADRYCAKRRQHGARLAGRLGAPVLCSLGLERAYRNGVLERRRPIRRLQPGGRAADALAAAPAAASGRLNRQGGSASNRSNGGFHAISTAYDSAALMAGAKKHAAARSGDSLGHAA